MRGGITIMGVELRTRERAVSETARVAALRDLPRDWVGSVGDEDEDFSSVVVVVMVVFVVVLG